MTLSEKLKKFANHSATVVGIGRSNVPLAELLTAAGASVTARDKKPRAELGEAADTLEALGVKLICGEDYLEGITEDYIFRAPGVRYDKPEFLSAVDGGSTLTSEMQLFFDLCPCPIVGITGSDGKTTTTTLVSLMLERLNADRGKVWLGGNIGRPLLPDIASMQPTDYAIVELSSFQLHTMTSSPNVAVVTNVTPNHLDYHTDMDEYIAAKSNIFAHQSSGDTLILNAENDVTRSMQTTANEGVKVEMFNSQLGWHFDAEHIYDGETAVLDVADILLPGRHNLENYTAAIAATKAALNIAGRTPDYNVIREIAKTFPGVEHRLEFVRELDGVKYYNGSIDSSPTRTLAALSAFKQKIIVICGGYDKHIPYEPLAPGLCKFTKAVVLTGATGPKIKTALENYVAENDIESPEVYTDDDFDGAVAKAREIARDGDIVLLSPASASFDRFKDFDARGKHFKAIVNSF